MHMPAGKTRLSAILLAGVALTFPPFTAAEGPPAKVDFERHVMGLMSRAGCNAGSCHGSFQGKNGFRLSLFGADPAFDHAALTRDGVGRRVDPLDPDRSLLLLKATGQVAHGGGRRFAPGSWQHRLLRDWVAAGATWHKGNGDVTRLVLSPDEYALIKPGQTGRVRVRAHFAGGSAEDVTHLCDFRAHDEAVAAVVEPGVIKAGRPGDTALLVSYRGNVRALRVLVPTEPPPGFRSAKPAEVNYIDREVFAKLRLLGVTPSGLSSDTEFLRRVTLDTIGSLPAAEEVRKFLADTDPKKREKKIDQLLAHPLHAALWATRFSDITGNNTALLRAPTPAAQVKYSQMWHDWFRQRIADNVPYDEIVRRVLCSTSRDGQTREEWFKEVKEIETTAAKSFVSSYAHKETLDLFWQVGKAVPLEQYAERTASAFLGVRLECAQCHKHPFDRWTQADYRAYANIFGHVVVGMAPDTAVALGLGGQKGKPAATKKVMLPKGAGVLNEVFVGGKGRSLPPPDYVPVIKEVVVAGNKKKLVLAEPPPRLPARALGGPVIPVEPGKDARVALFEWMRSPDNPFFARSFVNRVWAHYFGVGIVHPADDFSLANPPSNARLLDALAADFIKHRYDIRRLERTILLSRTYQLSSTMNATNRLDRNNYSHSFVRPLLAEVVVDVLGDALGMPEDFGKDAPPGKRAIEVGSVRLLSPDLSYALRTFGRGDRTLVCDCERGNEPTLAQTLYRMADFAVLHRLKGSVADGKVKGKPAREGRLAKLLASNKTAEEILEDLFLATLSRFPTDAEKQLFASYRAEKDREAACTDALWALLNTREFVLNH
jgi:hypothetical protein